MDVDDPWNWSIDRVVQELCTSNRSWQPGLTTTSMPDPELLEKTLRENEVSGSVLLIDVDDNVMRQDFGLRVLAQRTFLRDGIAELRLKSPQCQLYMQKHHPMSIVSSQISRGLFDFAHQQPPQSGAGLALQFGHPPYPRPTLALPAPGGEVISQQDAHSPASLQSFLQDLPSSADVLSDVRAARGEYIVCDASGNKRRKLGLTNSINTVALQIEDNPQTTQPDHNVEFSQGESGILTPAPEPVTDCEPESNGKKRKRIAPTLITSEIDKDRNRDIPTAADNVILNDPHNVEPGVPFIGDDGKKRLVPIHQSDPDADEPYSYEKEFRRSMIPEKQALDQGGETGLKAAKEISEAAERKKSHAHAESLSKGYLGTGKMCVDEIFYEGVANGQELTASEDPTEFTEGFRNISNGRRLYVHGIMKGFFRAERHVFSRDGKFFSAVRPYHVRLAPKHQNASFTLYYSAPDGQITAKREEFPSWPEIDPEVIAQRPVITGDAGPGVFGGVDSYADWDPSCLEKYEFLPGGDEVLPLYGESDEENEYDLDTWREMEEERGDALEKPLHALKRPHLTSEDVDNAIDEGVAEILIKWNEKQLPKLQRKAYRMWKKSGHEKKQAIKAAQGELKHLVERIAKLQREIAGEVWTSKLQVRKQTQILEPSIFDREDLNWGISILEDLNAPGKPVPRARSSLESKKSIVTTQDGEEGESIETDLSSPEDELEDFILSDDASSTGEEIELNLADGEEEDEDATMSDASLSDVAEEKSKSPSKVGKIHLKTPDIEENEPMSDVHDDTFNPLMSDDNANTATSLSSPGGRITAEAKEESNRPKLPTASLRAPPEVYDLTMLSSDDGPPVIDLVTPKKKRPLIKLINRNSSLRAPIQISDSDDLELPVLNNLPPYTKPGAIAQYANRTWESLLDRDRLLISVLHSMDEPSRTDIFSFISNVTEEELWFSMHQVLEALRDLNQSVKGMDASIFETLSRLARFFEIYVDCKYHSWRETPSKRAANKLIDNKAKWFTSFFQLCSNLENFFERKSRSVQPSTPDKRKGITQDNADDTDDDDEEGPQSAVKRRSKPITTSDEDIDEHDTPHNKRKRKIFEDTHARNLRAQDRLRLAEQELRRKRLLAALAKNGQVGDADGSQIIINDTKLDGQGFIHVDKEIGRRIKKHQVEGIKFMWNQIVTMDETSMQGCLLAHTMGLGKTMQVITLLVAIADAAKSADESVSSQIPKCLQVSKTLVLCPPGLIDNWMDELLTWAPEGLLGDFSKVDSSLKLHARLRTISNWYHDGGVLIVGYEMFRNYINNKKPKRGEAPLTQDQHEQICQALLQGPNIIIADEAHKMKNATAAITLAASQFRSKSRIALTGSPLANNVEEYHTMIEWVAPNYLGPAVEFRAKYVEPIQAGLWGDSSSYERRKSLKMLGVLKEDLAPKVNRADMEVLRNDLPPKKEFVITVPLTTLQRKAYSLYVESMTSGSAARTKAGEVHQTTIWHWLTILSLLCNHPNCFKAKLNERKEDVRKEIAASGASTSRDVTDEDEVATADLNEPIWKVGVSQDLINAETKLFNEEASDLNSIELSYKTKILCQILDASKAAGDKVLVFSQSLPTLNFLERLCRNQHRKIARLDGSTQMSKRQSLTKAFNGGDTEIYLISTTAGGLGLNLPGANRVIIFDFKFNPIMEEQAVGRAYRIGQKKPVFVYRFVAGGTFEDSVHNKAVFKMQLASRVIDKKNPVAWAKRKLGDFLFEPKEVEQKDLSEFRGMDPKVLDKILASQSKQSTIRAIVQSDTFERDDEDGLTVEEQNEVKQLLSDEQLKRSNPRAWHEKQMKIQQAEFARQAKAAAANRASLTMTAPAPSQLNVSFPPGNLNAVRRPGDPATLPTQKPQNSVNGSQPHTTTQQPTAFVASVASAVPSSAPMTHDSIAPPPPTLTPTAPSKSTRDLSPIAGANTNVRLTTPENGVSPTPAMLRGVKEGRPRSPKEDVLSNDRPPRSVTPVRADITSTTQMTTPKTSPAKNRSGRSSEEKKKVFRKLESALFNAAKRSTKPSTSSTDQAWQITSKLAVGIQKVLGKKATDFDAAMDAAVNVLHNDYIKCQAILDSQMSPEAFAMTILKSSASEIPSASSDGPDNNGKSAMFEAMNRKPVLPLKTPIAKSKNDKRSFRSPYAKEDAKVLQQIAEKRRVRHANAKPSPSPSKEKTSSRLPDWALSEIQEAAAPGPSHLRTASRSTPSFPRE